MKKKSLSIIAGIISTAIISQPFLAYSKQYEVKDVKSADSSYTAIQKVLGQGFMTTSNNGYFYPDKFVTRQDFAVILCRLNGDSKNLISPAKASFNDVNLTNSLYKYIETEKNYIPFNSKMFYPASYITRQDAAYAIVKSMGYDTKQAIANGVDPEVGLESLIADSGKVSASLKKYVSIAIANKLIDTTAKNSKEYFSPLSFITRKQLAAMLNKAFSNGDYNKTVLTKDKETIVKNENSKPKDYKTSDDSTRKSKDQITLENNTKAVNYIEQGISLFNKGKYQDALDCYAKAEAINPTYYQIYYNRGNAFIQLGKYDDALTAFKKAVSLEPKDYPSYNNIGLLLNNQKKYQDAINYYDKAITANPKYETAYLNKLYAFFDMENYKDAADCADKLIAVNPKSEKAYFAKGVALGNMNKLEDALTCFTKAIELNPNDASAYKYKGMTLEYLGKKDEAQTYYDKAKALGGN